MKNNVDVRTVALQRAIQLLNSLGAQYKIITAGGEEYGTLQAVKIAKRKLEFPMGAVRNYFVPLIKDMKVGDVLTVPAAEYGVERMQNGICAYATYTWGNKSVITRRDVDKNEIEVMRIV